MKSVAIIDVGCGNIGSLYKSLDRFFEQVTVIETPRFIDKYDCVFMPGSGSAGYFSKKLNSLGFRGALQDVISAQIPVIGICLGFQLLFQGTDEDGGVEGFGYFNGHATRISYLVANVARTGWFDSTGGKFWGLENDLNYYYFNHSFGIHLKTFSITVPHGVSDSVISWVKKGNVAGFQFHPEKSQSAGFQLFQSIRGLQWSV